MTALTWGLQDVGFLSFACVAVAFIWYLRVHARSQNRVRIRQLNEAADLLRLHARMLEKFLGDPAPSRDMKAFLLRFSSAMTDSELVYRLAECLSQLPLEVPDESAETRDLQTSLDALRQTHPDLAQAYATAVLAGVSGAVLRWQKTAALFDSVGSHIAANPQREVAVAVTTAASLRSGSKLGLPPRVPAIA